MSERPVFFEVTAGMTVIIHQNFKAEEKPGKN